MQVRSAFASVLDGLTRAERTMEGAARSLARASTASAVTSTRATSGASDPLEGRAVGDGDAALALVRMIAAQRAFDASLVALRADAEVQRDVVERAR